MLTALDADVSCAAASGGDFHSSAQAQRVRVGGEERTNSAILGELGKAGRNLSKETPHLLCCMQDHRIGTESNNTNHQKAVEGPLLLLSALRHICIDFFFFVGRKILQTLKCKASMPCRKMSKINAAEVEEKQEKLLWSER